MLVFCLFVCLFGGWEGSTAWRFGGVVLFSFVWDLFMVFSNLDIKLMFSFLQTSHSVIISKY